MNAIVWESVIDAPTLFQGLFGMVPAMYVDLAPDRQSCIWTTSMYLTLSHVVSMEVTLVMILKMMMMKIMMMMEMVMKMVVMESDNNGEDDGLLATSVMPKITMMMITKIIITTMSKVILRPITPYLIPGLLAAPVIVHLARALPSVEQESR